MSVRLDRSAIANRVHGLQLPKAILPSDLPLHDDDDLDDGFAVWLDVPVLRRELEPRVDEGTLGLQRLLEQPDRLRRRRRAA